MKLSAFKHALVDHLKTNFRQLTNENVKARNGNRFFAIDLTYPAQFKKAAALRPHILLEFTYSDLSLPAIAQTVSSFTSEYSGKEPEARRLFCINPVETASDKVSALVWRCMERVRGAIGDDPTIVRHLHDLHILSPQAKAHENFRTLVLKTLQRDDLRSSKLAGMTPAQKFTHALDTIGNDGEYKTEYMQFVQSMSYAATSEMPSFDQAFASFNSLVQHILNS